MDSDFIERLIGLFERSRLTELEFTENGRRVRLARAGSAGPDRAAEETAPPDVATRAPVAAPADSASAGSAPAGRHVIPAGMFGVFYRSPAPGQAPFVSVGDLVREGQTIAILEAMKTLNAVEADRTGRVEAILVEDGTSVEAGTPLVAMVLSGPS